MGQLNPISSIFIVTGPREIGKTTFIKYLLENARNNQLDTAGVFSPAVFENGIKIGIDLEDPRTGKRQRLANLRASEDSGVFTERWLFMKEVLDWGNNLLGTSTPCDLLLVDELGPIEFERGQGWQNGIKAILSGDYRSAVVVIRPELLEQAQSLWPHAQIININNSFDPQWAKIVQDIISPKID